MDVAERLDTVAGVGAGAGAKERLTHPWLVLALLTFCYALSGADRQMISILAEPLRLEFGLSDSQLGLLSGFMFALFYTGFGIPIAWLADRVNRVRIIAAACFMWSLFTAATALATSFLHLAAARVGVAVGEAGGSPPSYSLLSDYFPPEKRGTVLGIYSVGLPFGIAAGTAFGGWVAATWGWRTAFYAMAVPGILLAILLLLLVRHPQRGRLDPLSERAGRTAPPLGQTLRRFFATPVLWTTTLAGCLTAMSSYALMVWMPAFLMRTKGMTLGDVAGSYALVSGIAMVLGMLISGRLVDVLSRYTPRASALIPGAAYLVAAPLVLAAIWAADWQSALLYLVLPFALMMMWLPPVLLTIQNHSRPEERAVTAAIFLLLAGIVGNGGGPALVGVLSDWFARSDPAHGLHWALTAIVPVFLLASAAHFASALARRTA